MKINNIDVVDWSLPVLAKEHDVLNKTYSNKNEFDKYESFFKLKEAIDYIKSDDNPTTLLDVGCGAGWQAVYLNKKGLLNNLKYTGADLSNDMCILAKQNYKDGEYYSIDIIKEKIKEKYDIVMESAVLELVHDWEFALRNMMTASNKWLVFHRLFFTEKEMKYEQTSTYLNLPDIRIHISLVKLNEILKEQNFKIVKSDKWIVSDAYNMGTFVAKRS